ncbi:uncharacterized protein LOC127834379 [Dreissena polymorpha]|uniref:Uncharacterized protein n=1 Tax=Dreissena polymorpha TaxID=45954 RepID=A0A9D4G706_DREPO|nr:uncharacterized protein LOC127834379 [Dreissena polymorpha]XP_052216136.1 uncharacterized protein LOC127834379 [Dreissena polymorpha]XP_052216137.1 uncharacterized protein LOC127834379 [Dreissena polymorpha]XP_052216138.1 uncharacterized protein LOC127834379 [Dreissena polymorpha]XP_052216139.1 uncharacterized protein LOC127834379 [Dreissena polymorpha]XP_052216140.1 uncharacterized protein LOC127834379 [Dreissena polymorpha]XP_052216142.1 uncharacterized protein LOC127834379 [Dreissena po
MQQPAYKFDEDSIKCPMCSKHFVNPRLLPCLHSFCKNCLITHIQNGGQNSDRKLKDPRASPTKVTNTTGDHSPQTSEKEGSTLKAGSSEKGKPGPRSKSPQISASGTQENHAKEDKPPNLLSKPTETRDSNNRGLQNTKASGALQPTGTKYTTGDKGFPCPCCKKFTTTPQLPKTSPDKWSDLFPENNMLADLVDLHSLKLGTRVCDPCKRNQTTSQVTSYCKNCHDALCASCALTHKGLRSCRTHKVLSTAQFAEAINSLKVEEEFCSTHEGKLLEKFCQSHAVLCCTQCITDSHRHCEKTASVADVVQKAHDIGEVTSLQTVLDKYRDHVDVVLKDRTGLVKRLDAKKGKLLNEFVKVKSHIVSQLEKMEKDLKTILDATHKQQAMKIQQEASKCRDIQSGIVNTRRYLQIADQHGSNSQIIATIEKVKAECEYYEESINILCSRLRVVDYDIALDNSLQQVMKRLNQFGRIDVNTTPTNLPAPPKLAATLGLQSFSTKAKAVKPMYTLSGRNANEIGEFCARFEDDDQDCWLTGALFLADGHILLADRTNRKLKLFTSSFSPVMQLALSSKPWDVTGTSDREVAVSLPAECRIQFVAVEGSSLVPIRTISTDEPCFGVCYADGKILTVTYDGDPPNLKVLSTTGKELTYVCVDDDGFPLFSKPVYVTCTPKAEQIYVSDERLGCVVILKETGELNFAYSAMDLGNAAGLAIDTEGNIYVCGANSNSVHVVSPSGERVKVLVTGDNISYPRAVAYNAREKKLLVTQGDQDYVKVYNLA